MVRINSEPNGMESASPGKSVLWGMIILAIGLLAGIFIIPHSEFGSMWKFHGSLATTQGVVTARRDTKSTENNARIYAIDYSFTPSGGSAQRGTSYLRKNGLGSLPNIGSHVTVEYRRDQPQISRVRGMRSASFGVSAILVPLIFAFIGIMILVKAIPAWLRA